MGESFWLTVIKMAKKIHVGRIKIPEGTEINIDGNTISVKGKKGELKRTFTNPRILLEKEEDNVVIKCREDLKFLSKDKMFINTFRAHIKNLFKGANEGFSAKLKICSGHFPMNVSISGNILSIKNFLGEKTPRTVRLFEGVKVEITGDEISVRGLDKEVVGQTAAKIEQTTRITNRDRRIFQDGCFIIKKPGENDD